MMYLLDTCVVSETRAKKPNAAVMKWLSRQDPGTLYISAISIGEIKNGICLLGDTRKAKELSKWLSELETSFGSRVLSVNATVAECWGRILAESSRAGTPRPAVDALIVATARVDNLVLVTRNERDMQGTGVELLNPFAEPAGNDGD